MSNLVSIRFIKICNKSSILLYFIVMLPNFFFFFFMHPLVGQQCLTELWTVKDELQFAKSILSTHLIVELDAKLILHFLINNIIDLSY